MKHFLLAATFLLSQVLNAAAPHPFDTIEKAFQKAFPGAKEVTWYKGDLSYEVRFIAEQTDNRLWFNNDGSIFKAVRYYTGEHLAPFILARITQNYPGKKVYSVTEISSEEGMTYYIMLEDEKHWTEIQSDVLGNTITTRKFKKANIVL